MGRAANNPSRFQKPCERCKRPAPRAEHLCVTLYTDKGERLPVPGKCCRGCMNDMVHSALECLELICGGGAMGDPQCTGRYEVFDLGAGRPVSWGVYGRHATPDEQSRGDCAELILAEERSTGAVATA